MLDITLRVTTSSMHLEQIHPISVRNMGPARDGAHTYAVYADGTEVGTVGHRREDGALALARRAIDHVMKARKQPPRGASE